MSASEGLRDEHLKVTPPEQWATGVPAVMHSLAYSLEQTSLRRTALTLLNINQPNGIDRPGCAWPEPATGKRRRKCADRPDRLRIAHRNLQRHR
jgi:hypothetical protein